MWWLIVIMVGIGMLTNIVEPSIIIPVCCGIAATVTLAIQMGRFIEHKKTSSCAPELKNRYAVFAYGILPVMFSMIGVLGALLAADSLILHGIFTAGECPQLCAALAIVGAVVCDIAFRKILDATYFVTIEEKFLAEVAKPVLSLDNVSSEDLLAALLSRKR